jgi:hypothetical protein
LGSSLSFFRLLFLLTRLGTEGFGLKDVDELEKMMATQNERHKKLDFDRAASKFIIEQGSAPSSVGIPNHASINGSLV